MKNILLMGLLLSASTAFAQKLASKDELEEQKFGTETVWRFKKSQEPLEGNFKVAQGEGAYFDGTFSKGRMNGTFKYFDKKGDKIAEISYKNGEQDGKSIFYENGKVEQEHSYRAGKLNGEQKRFDEKGKLVDLSTYKDGKKDGKFWKKKTYRTREGEIDGFKEEFYKDDKPFGKWIEKANNNMVHIEYDYKDEGTYTRVEYWDNGKKESEKSYKDHKEHGSHKRYDKYSGNLERENIYDNGVRTCEKRFSTRNGKQTYEMNYKNGQRNGHHFSKYEPGFTDEEGDYKDGYKDGLWKTYYRNGNLESETRYAIGQREGLYKEYSEEGNVTIEGNFKNDQMDGIWKYYEAKKLVQDKIYKMGDLVKSTRYNENR
jgi:morn variant repeat protein